MSEEVPREDRVPMMVDPAVRTRLKNLLFRPELQAVGYSAFLTAAMDAYEHGDWKVQ